MTPICPHTLSNRSVVFSQKDTLKIHLLKNSEKVNLTLDGVQGAQGEEALPYSIKIAKQSFRLLQPYKLSHFSILRNKLRWGDNEHKLST